MALQLPALGRNAAAAAEAVGEAVRFMRALQNDTSTRALSKTDASPVTVADFAVQALLASRLAREFPEDSLVAEEDATQLRASDALPMRRRVVDLLSRALLGAEVEQVLGLIDRGGGTGGDRFWTLDPINGTKGLLRGGQYAIALALVINGRAEVAAVGCPRLSATSGPAAAAASPSFAVVAPVEDGASGGVAVAARGRGAWWMPVLGGSLIRLSVSTQVDPTRTRVLHSRELDHAFVAQLRRGQGRLGSDASPILMDSQAKHVLLAAGAGELLLRFPPDPAYREAIWDLAAGSLVIEEAGGRITDIDGLPLDFTTGRRLLRNRGLLASNGVLHDVALDAIRQST